MIEISRVEDAPTIIEAEVKPNMQGPWKEVQSPCCDYDCHNYEIGEGGCAICTYDAERIIEGEPCHRYKTREERLGGNMSNQEAYEEMCEKAEKYSKLKEAVGKIKAHLDSRRTAFTIKETYEEGRNKCRFGNSVRNDLCLYGGIDMKMKDDLISRREVLSKAELIFDEDGNMVECVRVRDIIDLPGVDKDINVTTKEQKESEDAVSRQVINVHEVKPTDKDYPALVMSLVPKAEQYTLFSIDKMKVVPLFQVLDAIMAIKPDIIRRDGVEYCANCGARIIKPQESEGVE